MRDIVNKNNSCWIAQSAIDFQKL